MGETMTAFLDFFSPRLVCKCVDVHKPLAYPCNAEVAELEDALRRDEDVLRLEVPVDDLAVVQVLERQAELHKEVEHPTLAPPAPRAPLPLHHVVQVALVRVLHHDEQVRPEGHRNRIFRS